jgi:antitoxin component of RelBE/YafQ-DinJ toxin-antitoxin module
MQAPMVDAFRMVRVAAEKQLPFDPLVSNPETVQTIRAAERQKAARPPSCSEA